MFTLKLNKPRFFNNNFIKRNIILSVKKKAILS